MDSFNDVLKKRENYFEGRKKERLAQTNATVLKTELQASCPHLIIHEFGYKSRVCHMCGLRDVNSGGGYPKLHSGHMERTAAILVNHFNDDEESNYVNLTVPLPNFAGEK